MSDYTVARLDEIGEFANNNDTVFRAVRHHFGITAFGVNASVARAAGDRLIPEHDEGDDGQEELYLVMHGRASFELNGEPVDAPAGTLVFARPGVKRTAFAQEPGTAIVIVGAQPGKPYVAYGWELWAPLRPDYEAGKVDEVAEKLRPIVDENPQYPMLAYNLACLESLGGRKDDAIEHLRRAVTVSDQLRELAQTDTDLDPIRDDPAVRELLTG